MPVTLASAVAEFGASAKKKLANPSATGQPEDQLRAPFEQLLADFATLADPAMGTGTFLLGVLRRIAEHFAEDEGEGAVKSGAQFHCIEHSRHYSVLHGN